METLLLTGTIKPSPNILFLNITDPKVRYMQYIQNIIRYICFSDAEAIVFCENSNYTIKDKDILVNIAKFFNKRLEILQFEGNHQESIKKGRGYGESEILEYAIDNSKLIKEGGSFIKITGRYWCENINNIIYGSRNHDICFSELMPRSFSKLHTKAVNTGIFKTTVGFFNRFLRGIGKDVDDPNNLFLEHVYYNKLKKISNKIYPLPEYPQMRGITGEGGILKKSKIIELVIYILHKLGINRI